MLQEASLATLKVDFAIKSQVIKRWENYITQNITYHLQILPQKLPLSSARHRIVSLACSFCVPGVTEVPPVPPSHISKLSGWSSAEKLSEEKDTFLVKW